MFIYCTVSACMYSSIRIVLINKHDFVDCTAEFVQARRHFVGKSIVPIPVCTRLLRYNNRFVYCKDLITTIAVPKYVFHICLLDPLRLFVLAVCCSVVRRNLFIYEEIRRAIVFVGVQRLSFIRVALSSGGEY